MYLLKFQIPHTTPSRYDFATWINNIIKSQNWSQYAITIIHNDTDSPWSANQSLHQFIPRFFSKTISPNWHRKSYLKKFVLLLFMEPPGSRQRKHNNNYELEFAQDSFHHHGILFLDPSLTESFEQKAKPLLVDDMESVPDTEVSFRKRSLRDTMQWLLEGLRSKVRTCHIEKVTDSKKWSTYAAKTIRPMLHHYPDEAYAIFPKAI